MLEGEALMNDASGPGGVEICCCSDDGNDGIQRSWRKPLRFLSLRWAVLPWDRCYRLYGKGPLLISRYAHDEPSIQIVLMLCCRLLFIWLRNILAYLAFLPLSPRVNNQSHWRSPPRAYSPEN
ncbi:hypothetical protein DMI65_14075 [Escherichia coli]|nr:hypothetical protein [Escherichia coli]